MSVFASFPAKTRGRDLINPRRGDSHPGKLTEEELPKRSAPDLLAELELAPDHMIHLSPRRIASPRSPLLRRDPSTPRKDQHGTGGRIESGFGAAGAQRGQIQAAHRGIRAAASSNRTKERTKGQERTNEEKWNLNQAKPAGDDETAAAPDPEKQEGGKRLFSPSKIPSRLGEGAGAGAGSGGWGRETRGEDGRQEEDEQEKRRRREGKRRRRDGDDDLISKLEMEMDSRRLKKTD